MTDVQPFTFPTTGHAVRTLLVDGTPWVVLRDALAVLNVGNVSDAVQGLDDDEFGTTEVVDSAGRRQLSYIVSEAGLYSLILRSRKPEAKAFKRWITHEVLPSIRRTGAYAAPVQQFPDMTTPEGRRAMARAFLEATEREVELTDRVAELEPKALAHDAFTVAADSDRRVAQVAKDLGWRKKDLRGFLLDEKLIFRRQRVCGGFEYDFYAAFRAHFASKETQVTHTWGPCNHYTLYVTPRGMELIHKRIADRQAEQRAAIEGVAR